MQVIRKLSRSALWSNRTNATTARLLRRLDPVGPDDLAPADDFGVNHPGSSFWRLLRGRKYGGFVDREAPDHPRLGKRQLGALVFRIQTGLIKCTCDEFPAGKEVTREFL